MQALAYFVGAVGMGTLAAFLYLEIQDRRRRERTRKMSDAEVLEALRK